METTQSKTTKPCKNCGLHFPHWIKTNGKIRILASRVYCLSCSPDNGNNRRQLVKYKIIDGIECKRCASCTKFKALTEFDYYRGYAAGACRSCSNQERKTRYLVKKKKAIEYKGGKCFDCKKTFQDCLYDFHHLEPHTKEFNIGQSRYHKWEKIKEELDKCVLLCAHCHRLRHEAEKN